MEIPSLKKRPTLKTKRLVLRPFQLSDARRVQLLAGDRDIAANTALIPHPYEDGLAEEWIDMHQEHFEAGEGVEFAVTLVTNDELIGAVGLTPHWKDEYAVLGYWIGKPYWKHGYCTEAARAVLQYAFDDLRLNRVYAHHLRINPASGRVMQKLGMQHEGHLRQHVKKWGEFLDIEAYGILRSEFLTPGELH